MLWVIHDSPATRTDRFAANTPPPARPGSCNDVTRSVLPLQPAGIVGGTSNDAKLCSGLCCLALREPSELVRIRDRPDIRDRAGFLFAALDVDAQHDGRLASAVADQEGRSLVDIDHGERRARWREAF